MNDVFESFAPDELDYLAGTSSPSRLFLEEKITLDVH